MINSIESVAAGSDKPWFSIGAGFASVGMVALGIATFNLHLPDWANAAGAFACYGILLFCVLRGHFEDHRRTNIYLEYLRSLDVSILKSASRLSAISARSRAEVHRFLNTHHAGWSAQ